MLQSSFKEFYSKLQDKIVLNVDDNEMNQLVLLKILKSVGIKIIQAGNGAEAIKKLHDGLKPDVILMDIEMPVMNGMQASEQIRKNIDHSIPIIINSGAVSAYYKSKLQRLGINDFLEKPYNLDDIFSKLTTIVTRGIVPA